MLRKERCVDGCIVDKGRARVKELESARSLGVQLAEQYKDLSESSEPGKPASENYSERARFFRSEARGLENSKMKKERELERTKLCEDCNLRQVSDIRQPFE